MSKHNKKEESIFDKIENMTGIPIMYLAIILAVVIVIIGIGISYMFPLGDSGESPPPVVFDEPENLEMLLDVNMIIENINNKGGEKIITAQILFTNKKDIH